MLLSNYCIPVGTLSFRLLSIFVWSFSRNGLEGYFRVLLVQCFSPDDRLLPFASSKRKTIDDNFHVSKSCFLHCFSPIGFILQTFSRMKQQQKQIQPLQRIIHVGAGCGSQDASCAGGHREARARARVLPRGGGAGAAGSARGRASPDPGSQAKLRHVEQRSQILSENFE